MRPLAIVLLLTLGIAVDAAAADRGTPTEARAMLQKAVAHYKSAGRKAALADFSASKAGFRDRDLYVVCIGPDQKIVANGAFPQYVGTSADMLKDAEGKPLGRAIIQSVANKNNEGSVSYPMVNPMTGKAEAKVMYAQKVGEDVCGVGAYNAK